MLRMSIYQRKLYTRTSDLTHVVLEVTGEEESTDMYIVDESGGVVSICCTG